MSNLVVGRKVVEGLVSWKGANLTTDLFIGGIDITASVEDAKAEIINQGVDVVEMEVLHRYNNSQCFRLRIRKADYEKILDPSF